MFPRSAATSRGTPSHNPALERDGTPAVSRPFRALLPMLSRFSRARYVGRGGAVHRGEPPRSYLHIPLSQVAPAAHALQQSGSEVRRPQFV